MRGTQQPALFFSLLVITLSFLPASTLEAQEGSLFSPLAFTKTYTMAVAGALSVTLVPVWMGYLVRGRIAHEASNPLNRVLMRVYRPALEAVLRFPRATLVITRVRCLNVLPLPAHCMSRRSGDRAGRERLSLRSSRVGTRVLYRSGCSNNTTSFRSGAFATRSVSC